MKVIIFGIVLITINQTFSFSIENKNYTLLRRNYNKDLKQFLEYDLRSIMRNGVPVLDPYYHKQQLFEYDDNKLNFEGAFYEFNIENLSKYDVEYSNVNLWKRKVDVNLYFPVITSEGFYDLKLIYQNDLYSGKGQYKAIASNFKLYIQAWVSIWGGLHVTSLTTQMSLGAYDFSATNNYLDSNQTILWCKQISKLIPKIIKEDHDALSSYISKKLIVLINDQL
ncbi:uncharacterized protein LOC130671608 [Microplitis mediator]|uniref:uncharacterized protein LOC130671608 n=1 Tax=Microplitis mediator TaxID=375433 RepID=UPI00255260A8|nr:uncharacterized protein LOC130671608 [Microplitis mediator]